MAGDWFLRIDFDHPYDGVVVRQSTETHTLVIEVPFGDKRSAMVALTEARMTVYGEHPVIAGEVVSERKEIGHADT